MMGIKEDLLLWLINFSIKSRREVVLIYRQILMNNQLKNYTSQSLKKLKKTVSSVFRENIWGEYLADIQLISKFNKRFRFSCVIDTFSKHAWVIPLEDNKGVCIVYAFQKILNDSNRKPNKIWVDKGNELYNNSFKI